MTCKEAIEQLKEILFMTGYKEAIDLAIKALMAYRDCKHCTHNIKVAALSECTKRVRQKSPGG